MPADPAANGTNTPPATPSPCPAQEGGGPAAFACAHGGEGRAQALSVLKHRAEFLRTARARRQSAEGFLLQARRRSPDEGFEGVRIGFTCSKKLGNAVIRNRAKRRLRALARLVLARYGRAGWDYVLVGRPQATVSRPWPDLVRDLERAIERIHADKAPRR